MLRSTSRSSNRAKLLTATLLAGATVTGSQAAVLYDQTNNPSPDAITSQNFEASFDSSDNVAADDFTVSAQGWTINQVLARGMYFNGSGPAASFNVFFYAGNDMVPGAAIASFLNLSYVDAAGDFTMALPSALALGAGTYWVGVQANMDFSSGGQWGWTERTVQSGNPSAWINPAGGFGIPCTDWGSRAGTCGVGSQPDLLFSLSGDLGTGQVPEPAVLALLTLGVGLLVPFRRRFRS